MKKGLLFISALLASTLAFSQVGLEGIVVEKYYVSDAADSVDAVITVQCIPCTWVLLRIEFTQIYYRVTRLFNCLDLHSTP